MKITLIADIHGNLPALKAVINHARVNKAANIILNLGDSIGYGPNPNEVVHWIQGSHFINIQGNYDKKALSKEDQKNQWETVKNPNKRTMFAWTCHSLSKSSRKFLKSLPKSLTLELSGKKLLLTHGSPASQTEHLRPDTSKARLEELLELTDANLILCGHSHQPFKRNINGVLFVNPGSVGRPDDGDPRASYAILDIHDGEVEIQHFRIPYHILETVRMLDQAGLRDIFHEIIRQGMNYDAIAERFGENPKLTYLEPNGFITLMTDFGLEDHFVGVMKGVIANIAPHAQVIDISHQIHPQDINTGARMLAEAIPFFPPGTVHVAVVDPGVGTARRALAARIGDYFYIAPDNGLLTRIIHNAHIKNEPIEIVELNQPKYWLPETSHSFHGRDIFSPVGAHLANGLPLEKLGKVINDPITLTFSQPDQIINGWRAEVVWVDTFGNLSTNLLESMLPDDDSNIKIQILGETIHGLTQTFGNAPAGELIATIDSTGHLAIAIVNGSAKESLNAQLGTEVAIIINQ